MDELLNIKEAASYLRLNSMTVYKLAQKRRIPAFKVGGNWRFKKDLLEKWLEQKSAQGNGTILIVDDDPLICELLAEITQGQNYNTVSVQSGESALQELDKEHFDLIFLDLILPGINGIDLLKAIKEKDKESIVVIVTGHADESIALEAMSLGPLLLIRKPFREKDIIEALSIVMKGKAT